MYVYGMIFWLIHSSTHNNARQCVINCSWSLNDSDLYKDSCKDERVPDFYMILCHTMFLIFTRLCVIHGSWSVHDSASLISTRIFWVRDVQMTCWVCDIWKSDEIGESYDAMQSKGLSHACTHILMCKWPAEFVTFRNWFTLVTN